MYNKFQIVFDPAKNQSNILKHSGASLQDALRFEWDTALTWVDQRHDYQEQRMRAIGYIGVRLFHVVYVDRGPQRRIISLRKANQREEQHYAKT